MNQDYIEQEWIVVKSKKRKRIEKEIKIDLIQNKGSKQHVQKDKIEQITQAFCESQSFKSNLALFDKVFQARSQQITVHCLGLGNFLTELKPFLQWLFFKKIILQTMIDRNCSLSKNIFDPVFSQEEKEEIRRMNSTILQLTDIKKDNLQVFYMPHCQRNLHQLVCTLKMKYPTTKFLVIGNSISQYKFRSKLLQQAIHESFIEFSPAEIKIKDYRQAFNDMFIYQL